MVQGQDYYPFGLKFNSYSRDNSLTNKVKLFQGQEHVDDLGVNWDSFKWRNYMPDVGRFFNVDPLAEKYVHNGTYAFAENKVITFRELEGLEGVHYMDGGDHVVEKNVVALLKRTDIKAQTSSGNSDKKNARIERRTERTNERNARDNAETINNIRNDLNSFYNGTDGKGSQNSAGQNVTFKFNITGKEVADTKGGSSGNVFQMAIQNGIETSQGVVQAAIFTTRNNGGSHGSSVGNLINGISNGAPPGTASHEVGHALLLPDNYSNGGVMALPPNGVSPSEVDQIIQKSKEK